MVTEIGLGQRIRSLRTQRGWSLDQLAKEGGTTKGFLSQVENGHAQPTGRVLLGVAKALGASVDWLLTGSGRGVVVEMEKSVEIPPELAALAVERDWSADKVFRVVGAYGDLLARRSQKARHVRPTKKEWTEFVDRIEQYLDEPAEEGT